MSFTAKVSKNLFHQIFAPPQFTTALVAPALLTELDTVIQTESSQDISVEMFSERVQYLTATRVGLNLFHAVAGST